MPNFNGKVRQIKYHIKALKSANIYVFKILLSLLVSKLHVKLCF